MRRVFGLYLGQRLLTELIAPADTSDDDVRALALAAHERNPGIAPDRYEAPFEFAYRLRRSTVKRFN